MRLFGKTLNATLPGVKSEILWLVALFLQAAPLFATDTKTNSAARIAAVFQADRELKGIAFTEVIEATTGKKIIPLDLKTETDRELISKIGAALDKVLQVMNSSNSVAQKQRRINEVSSHFENAIKAALNEVPGFSCDFPRTAIGKVQRSGYPDLRLVDKKSGAITFLDPKLFEQGSRTSSFRTFYFEPKLETGKIHDDAHHLIVGIEHDARGSGHWKFLNWELVDVSGLCVRLKAEFQGSNQDLYRPELIVGTSRK
jgi:hypothetical protein